MKLSDQAKRELIEFSSSVDFRKIQKVEIVRNPVTEEATKQFTDFIQAVHRMIGHPVREHKPMVGTFLL